MWPQEYRLKKILGLILLLGLTKLSAQNITISGYVKENTSEENLGNISIVALPSQISTVSNAYGFYSLVVPSSDSIILSISASGFVGQEITFSGKVDINYNIIMRTITSTDVEIVVRRNTVADKPDMGRISIPTRAIKEIPTLLGEKDVLKTIQLLPGVQKGSEGQSGIYVRGGGPDQNLIILDEAPVYNANHLFGFFSLFNGDALKSVELIKGGFPGRYGGRLSSVLDLQMKEGNKNKYTGEAGIGLIAARGTLEGPIKKGKSSFLVSARRTYVDILAAPLIAAANDGQTGGYFFYDANAKINYEISDKDKLYLSGYFGRDRFYARLNESQIKQKFSFSWGNRTGTLRWNHKFNNRTFSNTTLIASHYDLTIAARTEDKSSNPASVFELKYFSQINDWGIKQDWDFKIFPGHDMKAGVSSTIHVFKPSAVVINVSNSPDIKAGVKPISSIENGIYFEDKFKLGKFNFYPSIRVSHYSLLETGSKQFFQPEPRLSMSYQIKRDMSVKASYAMMNQYIHLLSSTGVGLPTDLWIPATNNLKPQNSQIVSVGFAKDFLKQGYNFTWEAYYKEMVNVITYKDGASFLLADDPLSNTNSNSKSWEKMVWQGKGYSYGSEFFVQKQAGKFTGWVGYTLSWTQFQFDQINDGKRFFARYDRRHDASIVVMYKLKENINLSAVWVYGTGNALNLPVGNSPYLNFGNFDFSQNNIYQNLYTTTPEFGERNSFRAEAYHRMDIGITFSKKLKHGTRSWDINVYNTYNRRNPFFYEPYVDNNKAYLSRITLFPIIPSISYSFKWN